MQDYQYVSQLLFYHSALLEQMIYNTAVRIKRSGLQRQSRVQYKNIFAMFIL